MHSLLLPIPQPAPHLIGIARLAASGQRLEAKRRVEYCELPTRSLLNRCSSDRMPFQWTINPYRGCEFACRYCYARYTHEFLELRDSEDFERRIFVKPFDAAKLRRELAPIRRSEAIAIGTATDPYQPAERRFRRTRAVLEVLAEEHGRRISLTTKSDLVQRDIDVFRRIARRNVLHILLTITTVDEALARLLEPGAPRPVLRFRALEALASAGIPAGVLCAPVMPWLNDSEDALDRLAAAAAKAGAACFGAGILFLRPCARAVMFPLLAERFPALARRYRALFRQGDFLRGAWAETVKERIRQVRKRYGLPAEFADYSPADWPCEEQMRLELA